MRRLFAGPAFLLLAGLLIFGPHAPRSGLHNDDHLFHAALSRADFSAARTEALHYVPGRNLNVVFYWLLYRLLGPSPAAIHCAGLTLTLLNVLLVWGLCGQMRLPDAVRLLVAGLFLVYPNHGETHFWSLAVTQNVLPATFVLLAAFITGCARIRPAARLVLALFVYTLAFFDYDQAFFMWIPLLFYFWIAVPEADMRLAYKAAAAAFCLAMSLCHVLLRIYVPISNGGRPVIRFANVFQSFAHSLSSSFVPMQKLPLWDYLRSWAGGPIPTILMLVALAFVWMKLSAAFRGSEPAAPAPTLLRAATFGVLWFFCAYLPNYFWYISPRHNYIPSVGLLLALTAVATLFFENIGKAARAGLGVFVFLAFGLFASADIAEGSAWARSNAALESFGVQAAALLPAQPDNLFLIGAPSSLGRAPAFKHPREADYAYLEKSGFLAPDTDLQIGPGRTGFFFYNETDLFGEELLQWRAYPGANILTYGADGKIGCARKLLLAPPGAAATEAAVASAMPCAQEVPIAVPAWLVSSAPAPAAGPALFSAGNGAALTGLSAREGAGWLELTLRWRADGRIARDFAASITLLDASGRPAFSPVYSSVVLGQKTERALWPAYDDLAPASGWKPGAAREEVFRYRADAPLPAGGLSARIVLFERVDRGPWRKSGPFSAEVRRS